jgi:hypothetical protein
LRFDPALLQAAHVGTRRPGQPYHWTIDPDAMAAFREPHPIELEPARLRMVRC